MYLKYCEKKDLEILRSKYKKEIEKYIKKRHKNIKYEYGKVRYNTDSEENQSTTYGWKGLAIKD